MERGSPLFLSVHLLRAHLPRASFILQETKGLRGRGRGHSTCIVMKLWADFCFNNENLAEFYEDEPTLEQYSPLLGENFITYPMLEEYGVPTVEEFPEEDPDEEDEDDEKEEDSLEAERKDKKDGVTRAGGRENSAFALLFKTEMGELLCPHMDSDECNP